MFSAIRGEYEPKTRCMKLLAMRQKRRRKRQRCDGGKKDEEPFPIELLLAASVSTPGRLGIRGTFSTGDRWLDDIYRIVDRLGPYESQRTFIRNMIINNLCNIYGAEFLLKKQELMARFGIDHVPMETFILAERDSGKSHAVAMMTTALALVCPGLQIIIFAQTLDIAKEMRGKIYNFIVHELGARDRIETCNVQNISTRHPDDRLTHVQCSASGRTAKGKHPHVIIVDEFCLHTVEFIGEVLIPMLGNKHASFVGITTPVAVTNFTMRFMFAKDKSGDNFFTILKHDPASGDIKHKSRGRLDRWRHIYQTLELTELYNQEFGAVPGSGVPLPVFPAQLVTAGFDNLPNYGIFGHRKDLFVCIDPSAGGASRFAIVSGYRRNIGDDKRVFIVRIRYIPLPPPLSPGRSLPSSAAPSYSASLSLFFLFFFFFFFFLPSASSSSSFFFAFPFFFLASAGFGRSATSRSSRRPLRLRTQSGVANVFLRSVRRTPPSRPCAYTSHATRTKCTSLACAVPGRTFVQ